MWLPGAAFADATLWWRYQRSIHFAISFLTGNGPILKPDTDAQAVFSCAVMLCGKFGIALLVSMVAGTLTALSAPKSQFGANAYQMNRFLRRHVAAGTTTGDDANPSIGSPAVEPSTLSPKAAPASPTVSAASSPVTAFVPPAAASSNSASSLAARVNAHIAHTWSLQRGIDPNETLRALPAYLHAEVTLELAGAVLRYSAADGSDAVGGDHGGTHISETFFNHHVLHHTKAK